MHRQEPAAPRKQSQVKRQKNKRKVTVTTQKYPKLNADRDYFKTPNCLFSLGLSAGEIAVYSYLLRCEDRNSYTCYPSFRTIGKAVGLSRNTVQKYVYSLEDKGLIETEKTFVFRKDGSKWNGNLKFSILPIQSALGLYNEQQALNTHSSPQKPL